VSVVLVSKPSFFDEVVEIQSFPNLGAASVNQLDLEEDLNLLMNLTKEHEQGCHNLEHMRAIFFLKRMLDEDTFNK